jgi:Fic family protein
MHYCMDVVFWLKNSIAEYIQMHDDLSTELKTIRIISLACDAHTKLVHIHSFSDGNGRLARIVAGLNAQLAKLPMPMFLKDRRAHYIDSVGAATIKMNYTILCHLNMKAILRSAEIMVKITNNDCLLNYIQILSSTEMYTMIY